MPSKQQTNKKKITGPKKIKAEELYLFSNLLATLIEAGIPMLASLTIMTEQTDKKDLKKVLQRVIQDINEGADLTTALSKFPHIFSNLFVSMVRAGEKGGKMVQVLQQLSDYMKAQDQLQRKIKAALSYPKFVFSFFGLVLLGIIFGLIPKFQAIFESFNTELPLPTRILIDISEFAKDHLLIELALVLITFFMFKKYRNQPAVRAYLDDMTLKIPFMGDLILKSILSKFCSTLGLLLKSGVSLVDSLDMSSQISENIRFRTAMKKVRTSVIEGGSVHQHLGQFSIFPALMVQMISVGERSGALDEMLYKIAEIYEGHVDSKISGLTSIIEPVIMVCLGAVALVVIIALYLPIFNMSGAIQ